MVGGGLLPLGRCGALTVEQARSVAQGKLGQIGLGQDSRWAIIDLDILVGQALECLAQHLKSLAED